MDHHPNHGYLKIFKFIVNMFGTTNQRYVDPWGSQVGLGDRGLWSTAFHSTVSAYTGPETSNENAENRKLCSCDMCYRLFN